jgi:hypothetical protein
MLRSPSENIRTAGSSISLRFAKFGVSDWRRELDWHLNFVDLSAASFALFYVVVGNKFKDFFRTLLIL